MSKLYLDMAAEKEADDIGKKFMNSTDVVGDMSRTYGADLSSVKIHTDEGAARKAEERGVDAFSTGKDVFFARDVFRQNDPDSRGLLAHELSHSLQQGVGGGTVDMDHSAPMGAEQGGLFSWFRDRKRRKQERQEIANLEISDPTLIHSTNDAVMKDGLYWDKDAVNDNGDKTPRDFMNYRSYALNQMVQGLSREQLQNPALRKAVQEDYNTNMNQRLRSVADGASQSSVDEHFRGRSGELHTLNMVLGSFVPENYSDQVLGAYKSQGSITGAQAAIGYMADTLGKNEPLMEFMGGLGPSFDGVQYYDGDVDAQSDKLMNNFVLRIVNGEIAKKVGLERRKADAQAKKKGIQNPNTSEIGKTDLNRSVQIQKALSADGKANGSFNSARLRSLLVDRLRKR